MFDLDMGPTADELQRLADEARACRERLQELLRVTAELRKLLAQPGPGNTDETAGEPPRKLQSVP
jgi:hypothetical protein